MISGKKRKTVLICASCGKKYEVREGELELSKCIKCGGKDFTRTQETEVITK